MNHYKLLVSEQALCDEFAKLVEMGGDPLANWNSNRYGYVANLFYESFNQADNKFDFIKLALRFPKEANVAITVANKRKLTEPLLGKKYKGSDKASSTLRTLICLIELHLSFKKIVRFDPAYQQNYKITRASYSSSGLFNALPELQKCLIFMSTPVSVDEHSDLIPEKWVSAYKKYIAFEGGYKAHAGVIAGYRRLVFTLGLHDFLSLNDAAVKKFRSLDKSSISRSYGKGVPFFRQLGSINLTSEGVATTRANKQIILGEGFKDDPNNRLHDDGYVLVRGNTTQCCGLPNLLISIKRSVTDNLISFDGYEFNGSWASYNLSNFKDVASPWIKAQREFVSSFPERSTKKNVSKGLQFLNAYLFHYLKHFFASHDVPYKYPEKISDFKNAIYISPSDIVSEHLYQSTDIQFPLSLVDWIKITNEKNKDSVTKARASKISKFFDFVVAKYRGVDGYDIEANPLGTMDLRRIQGQGYKRSNKKLMELEYWKLFTDFLYVIVERVISDIEGESNIPKTGKFSVNVDRDIEFGKNKVHVGNLETVDFKRCRVSGKHYVQPQILLAFLIMAKSGLRMSNVMNLDVRSYDQNVDNLMDIDDGDFIELHVNTDKAKSRSFPSLLSVPVFKLLKRFIVIRDTIAGVPTTPFPYNRDEQSKWGDVLPILAITENNHWDGSIMPSLLNAFEICVKESGLNLGSEVFYKPIFLTPKSFSILKATKHRTPTERYCIHYKAGESAYFTPIDISTEVTPHSFRKTLDTYYSILLGDKETGQFFTGQSEATVGYYREVSPEVVNQVMHYTDSLNFPDVVPVKMLSWDDEEIRKQIVTEGLKGVNGFTLSVIESDIDTQLSATNPSDIAINQTHICIYGNSCPPEILDGLQGKKNCAVCPVAIGTPHDGVAIAAQIKYHVDNIAELNEQLLDEDLTSAECTSLRLARADELNFACSWFVRHKFIIAEAEKLGNYHVLEDGGEKIKTKLKYMMASNESEEIYSRLMETSSSPTMQSNKLKQIASRLSRKLVRMMGQGDIELPDIKPVEVALQFIGKVADVHGIPKNKLDELIKESGNTPTLPLGDLLQLGELDER